MSGNGSLYDRLIAEIFRRHDGASKQSFSFSRDEMAAILYEWDETIRNLGDVIYSYRGGRRSFPEPIASTGHWVIKGAGRGTYIFERVDRSPYIRVPTELRAIPLLDATPEIILQYGKGDEQSLLAKVRYNRLVDTFLRVTAYHLQGHVRASVVDEGQVEVDDLYLGVDKEGVQYVIPVEAKTADESLGIIQVASQNAFARSAYPELQLRSVAAKLWHDGTIFMMEFSPSVDAEEIEVLQFRRYKLIREEPESRERD